MLLHLRIKHKYESRTLRGFAGTLTEELKAEFEKNDAVKYVGESCCHCPVEACSRRCRPPLTRVSAPLRRLFQLSQSPMER